ncbi:hypothetical protein [Xanthobacter sediminis]
MADVSSDLIYEVLEAIQRNVAWLRDANTQSRAELIAMRGHLNAIQQDVHNLYTTVARQDDRMDRIERRLDLADAH